MVQNLYLCVHAWDDLYVYGLCVKEKKAKANSVRLTLNFHKLLVDCKVV